MSPRAQERGQEHGVQERGHEQQSREIRKTIEPSGMEHIRMEPTGMECMRIKHIMIRSKAVGRRTKPKRLCRRIRHIRKGKIVVRMRVMYENIEHGSAE